MNCPIDAIPLKRTKRYRMEVDECPKCRGMWLSPLELDRLEDLKFKVDSLKGSILVSSTPTELPCPVCGESMREFNYRFHQLRLDHCPQQHGFWLDAGEDKRVLEIMTLRRKDAERKILAEQLWQERVHSLRVLMFREDPDSLRTGRSGKRPGFARKQDGLPPHIEARPPADTAQPVKLPFICPGCGAPVNAMTIIKTKSKEYVCGFCQATLVSGH